MSLGLASRQGNLLDDLDRFCEEALAEGSVYSVLHRERDKLFPDQFFSDLFSDKGRRSVPPSVVAVVMVLQRLAGVSDREASSTTPSTPAGATRQASAATTAVASGASPTPSWSTCAPGWAAGVVPGEGEEHLVERRLALAFRSARFLRRDRAARRRWARQLLSEGWLRLARRARRRSARRRSARQEGTGCASDLGLKLQKLDEVGGRLALAPP